MLKGIKDKKKQFPGWFSTGKRKLLCRRLRICARSWSGCRSSRTSSRPATPCRNTRPDARATSSSSGRSQSDSFATNPTWHSMGRTAALPGSFFLILCNCRSESIAREIFNGSLSLQIAELLSVVCRFRRRLSIAQ